MKSKKSNTNLEETCEADQKLTSVKYVVGGHSDLMDNINQGTLLGRGCLSEKSSDSGVSSSSLSSANLKDNKPVLPQNITENPANNILHISDCANRTSSNTASKINFLKIQSTDKN